MTCIHLTHLKKPNKNLNKKSPKLFTLFTPTLEFTEKSMMKTPNIKSFRLLKNTSTISICSSPKLKTN